MPLLKLAEHYFYILSRFFRVDSFFRPFRFALCHSSLYQKVKYNYFFGLALSEYCGSEDLITPISPEDEIKRQELGFRGSQNYRIPLNKYSKQDILNLLFRRKRIYFCSHAAATFIMKYINPDIWNNYYKFCFERNPWDKVISYYYWRYRSKTPRPSISEFIQSGEANTVRGFNLYTFSGEIVVDTVYKYEELHYAMDDIYQRIGLGTKPSLPHAKGHYRKDRRSYRDVLDERDKEKIAQDFAREIAYFNYAW
ncbi:hypothetical protein KFU94_70245 [Chloroflexi bacterium TSY]|nr:hypothetical protein [Chloroflexi bacterium TSY]